MNMGRNYYPAEHARFNHNMLSEAMIWHQFDDRLLVIIRDEVITIDSTYMKKIFRIILRPALHIAAILSLKTPSWHLIYRLSP